MNKRNIVKWVGVLMSWLPLLAVAQPGHLLSSARSVDTGAVRSSTGSSPIAAPAQGLTFDQLRILPLFGGQSKTPEHIEWEIHFLSDCDQNFSSRTEASEFFSARAWDYLGEGQLDTATHRFNLAYVLNPQNQDSYWGLGVVTYQRGQLPDAIRLLKKGIEVSDTNAVLITDLATVQLKLYEETKDSRLLDEAITWLNRSVGLNAGYASTYVRLSWARFSQGDYAQAWKQLHLARAIDLGAVDLVYLNQLMDKMPDPQGFFKK